jgi:hypothetical protein
MEKRRVHRIAILRYRVAEWRYESDIMTGARTSGDPFEVLA